MAVAFAFLVVIPEGDLLLSLFSLPVTTKRCRIHREFCGGGIEKFHQSNAFALSFLFVIPQGSAVVLAFLFWEQRAGFGLPSTGRAHRQGVSRERAKPKDGA